MSNHTPKSVVPAVAGFVTVAAVLCWALYQGFLYDMTGGSSIGLIATIVLAMGAFLAVIAAATTLVIAARRPAQRVSSVQYQRRGR